MTGLFWSADSQWLGFFADTKLKKIALDGGAPIPLCDAPPNGTGTWSESGDILFGSLSRRVPIRRVSSDGTNVPERFPSTIEPLQACSCFALLGLMRQ